MQGATAELAAAAAPTTVLDDLESGAEALTLSNARNHPLFRRDGRRPSLDSVYRWSHAGIRGAKLGTARIGGSTVTTAAAIERFIGELNGGQTTRPAADRARRERQLHDAELRTAAAGI